MKITPESLVEAALTIGKLGDEIEDKKVFPDLKAERGILALIGSPIAGALGDVDGASLVAQQVIASRHAAVADLLYTTAAQFKDQDQELADKLAKFGDLNSTGA